MYGNKITTLLTSSKPFCKNKSTTKNPESSRNSQEINYRAFSALRYVFLIQAEHYKTFIIKTNPTVQIHQTNSLDIYFKIGKLS